MNTIRNYFKKRKLCRECGEKKLFHGKCNVCYKRVCSKDIKYCEGCYEGFCPEDSSIVFRRFRNTELCIKCLLKLF